MNKVDLIAVEICDILYTIALDLDSTSDLFGEAVFSSPGTSWNGMLRYVSESRINGEKIMFNGRVNQSKSMRRILASHVYFESQEEADFLA